jgi:nucleoside-diphosphate-sugar epimerase
MKIVVTGVTGFVGRHLLDALNNTEHQLCLLLRNEAAVQQLNTTAAHTLVFLTDTSWKEKIKQFQPKMVIHLAAYLTSTDDTASIDKLINSNLMLGTHLLDALKDTGLSFFINTGTFAEYNGAVLSPAYLYAATKTAYRPILQYYSTITGFTTVNVIPYTVYGGISANKKLVDLVYESVKAVVPVDMSPGEQVLDFIHIDDVVDFYITLIKNTAVLSEKYYDVHLGTGKGTTPKQLAQVMEDIMQQKTNINWGGRPYRSNDTMYAVAPESKLMATLHWQPAITLQQGLEKYYNDNSNNGI